MTLSRRSLIATAAVSSVVPGIARSQSDRTVRIAIGGFPTENGNAYANIQTPTIIITSGLFDGLTRLKKDGSVDPWLATSWEALDPNTWRFSLRDDVVFSNGKPFDAGAVVHAVTYLAGPGPATEGVRRDMTFLDSAKAIDRHTVEITTNVPTPTLPRYLAAMLVVEPDAWQSMGVKAFSDDPVGTGPLIAESWDAARLIFRANRTSWRVPQVDRFEFIRLADTSARLQALMAGGLDVAYQMAPEDIPVVEDLGGTMISTRDAAAASIMLNFQTVADTPLKDVRVRQALNMAVDRQTIVDVLLDGRTVVSTQPAVSEAYGYDLTIPPYPYDPDQARALLAEAGYGTGFSMTLETSGGGTNGPLVVQRVADDLGRVGVNVTIQQTPVMRFLMDFVRGRIKADAFTLQWGSYPTLDAIQMANIASCRKSTPFYCDETIQPVIEAAFSETNPDKALALRHQVMRYYRDQAPSIFLHENVAFIAQSARTSGYDHVFGFVPYEDIRLA